MLSKNCDCPDHTNIPFTESLFDKWRHASSTSAQSTCLLLASACKGCRGWGEAHSLCAFTVILLQLERKGKQPDSRSATAFGNSCASPILECSYITYTMCLCSFAWGPPHTPRSHASLLSLFHQPDSFTDVCNILYIYIHTYTICTYIYISPYYHGFDSFSIFLLRYFRPVLYFFPPPVLRIDARASWMPGKHSTHWAMSLHT